MHSPFVLYAPNVHSGGGLVLLRGLLTDWPKSRPLTAFLDARARQHLTLPNDAQVIWVIASISSRLRAEISLREITDSRWTVFCFHGLPPMLPISARVVIFQQNKLHLDLSSLSQFSLKTRTRLLFERIVIRVFRYRVAEYVVQTPSMQRAVSLWYGKTTSSDVKVRILPFINALPIPRENKDIVRKWDFIYVADGEAHKNHLALLSAWRLLAKDGLHPSLALTLSPRDLFLKRELEVQVAQAGLRIKDLGQIPYENVLSLYSTARAMIFPSISESFGLPLIEASHMGLPIIASELDYVRDVCCPIQTFDPTSPVSIARAVKRFLGFSEPALTLRTPYEFWRELLRTAPE